MLTYNYMLDHPMENLSWCKPYMNDQVSVAVCENKIVGMSINGINVDTTSENIRNAAKFCNPEYDLYEGYSDREILLMGDIQEAGCVDCPWFYICEAMKEEI
mgnify:CR=1 FL=1